MKLHADLFRASGAECYATAQKVKTLEVKQAYLELTQGWRALADEIERLDRNRPKHLAGLGSMLKTKEAANRGAIAASTVMSTGGSTARRS